MTTERERIKRLIGYAEFPGENDLLRRDWIVTSYVHVDGNRYVATDMGDRFLVRISNGVYVCGETLEKARDRVIEALEKKGT
ncbi:MAG: hypothetical protein V7606_3520 [Burkholderiales bacterium]|jgi:hypothetical protein